MSQLADPTLAAAPVSDVEPKPAILREPRQRSTPLSSRGEPVVWITGMAMAICLIMIVGLLAITVWQGTQTFWPRPIHTLTFHSGSKLMGMPMTTEAFTPNELDRAAMQTLKAENKLMVSAFDKQGMPLRTLYRVGNKEIRGQPFEWVEHYKLAALENDPRAVLLERNNNWGVWVGRPERVVKLAPGKPEGEAIVEVDLAAAGVSADGQLAAARDRARNIARLSESEVGRINHELEAARRAFEQVKVEKARTDARAAAGVADTLSLPLWIAALALALGLGAGAVITSRKLTAYLSPPVKLKTLCAVLWIGTLGVGLLALLERPGSQPEVTAETLASAQKIYEQESARLNAEYEQVLSRIKAIDAQDAEFRLIVRDVESGRFAPTSSSAQEDPMRVSSVVRWVEPNTLTFTGKVGVYLDRWREFLFDQPRNTNTEGGIFPVIFGTVLLTLLLSIVVVPLGVVAALYMREYAKQGVVISIVRICVNNLAGVPSIVYGVFGLGFFCYTLGKYIDRGPTPEYVAPRGAWWPAVIGVAVCVLLAMVAGLYSRPRPGSHPTKVQKSLVVLSSLIWMLSVLGVVGLLITTPYFHGMFESNPAPTFGGRGILWGALTLALLTLPVVIVATEEAIAAVPRTMREGSYGCGATKWQTIQRIVLPRAMPGIMTGMILAMARGAGEVAPLMLVGAVKLAPELPIDGHFPFVHLERSFMHLGFHIYDVGFQSPDSEAARPVVWTTTLVLVFIVLMLNLAAIRIRSRLRSKFVGGAF